MAGSMRAAAPVMHSCRCGKPSSSCTATAVRRLSRFGPAKAQVQPVTQSSNYPAPPPPVPTSTSLTPANIPSPLPTSIQGSALHAPGSGHGDISATYFDTSGVLWVGLKGQQPPDPNKAKLGKTLRILQERLPNLLQSPLPQDILAPNINLQLFPTTHPHLPTVSGRVAYNAALWTSPIAWNRVPIIGNVKLEILAERMTSEPLTFLPRRPGAMPEQLVVRWSEKCRKKTDEKKSDGYGYGIARSFPFVGGGVDPKKAFTGLFIFDFDKEGRILTHTIEQAQAGGNWEKGVGAKVVGLTDWLLGGIKDPGENPLPMFEKLRRRRHE